MKSETAAGLNEREMDKVRGLVERKSLSKLTGTRLRREGVSGAEGPLIRKNLRLSRTKEGGGAAKKRVEMKSAEKKGYIGNRERRQALHHAFQQRWRGRGENWKLGLGRRERKKSARLERGKGE